jgi:hypothetical protein
MDNFPRLLVATEFPPNAGGGGPTVVRQMLKHWPTERLIWWSCLPDEQRLFGFNVDSHRVATIPRKLYPHNRITRLKGWFLGHIWAPWASRHLRNTIRDLKPDVIWVIPHQWSVLALGQIVPFVGIGFHVSVQDYADNQSCTFRFGVRRSREMAAVTDQLYASATTRDATSHPMIEDLRNRTGASAAQMLHAGLEPTDFDYLQNKAQGAVDEIRIAYAGTILVEDTFAIFVEALNQVRNRISRPVFLEFFICHS